MVCVVTIGAFGVSLSYGEEMISPQNVFTELLKSIFEKAFMEVSLDKDGDVVVEGDVRTYIMPKGNEKTRIKNS